MTIPFLSNLAYVLLGYLLTYAAGTIIVAFITEPESSSYYEFKKQVFGVWLLIAGYSIIQTAGHTLSTGLLFLAVYAGLYYRPKLRWRPVINMKALLYQTALLSVFFVLLYVQFYDPFSGSLRMFPADFGAQATLIEKLNSTGIESTLTDFYYREPVRNLYHYGDLWYPALFARLFGITAMESLCLLYAAIGVTVITTGAFALARQVRGERPLSRIELILVLGFIGLSALSFYIPKSGWLDARWPEHFTLINQPKVYWVAVAALYAVIALYRDDLMGFTLSLLTVAILYFIAVPALLTGWFFVLGYGLVVRSISWPSAVRLFIPVFGMVLFFAGYALLVHAYIPVLGSGSLSRVVTDERYVADLIYTVIYTGVRVLIASWPIMLLGWLVRRELNTVPGRQTICFLLAGMAGGILAYSLVFYEPDGFQLWSVPHTCLMAILVFVLLFQRGIPAWLKLVVLVLCWYQNIYAYWDRYYLLQPYPYQADFIDQVLSESGPSEGGDMAVIRKPLLQAEDSLWCSDPNQYFPYDLLKWKLRAYHPYNISLLDTELQDDPAWANFQRAYLRHSTFGQFVDREKKAGAFVSVEFSQLHFLREARIRFLLIEPGARPNPLLDPEILKTHTDKQTGYRFCVLREPVSDRQQ